METAVNLISVQILGLEKGECGKVNEFALALRVSAGTFVRTEAFAESGARIPDP